MSACKSKADLVAIYRLDFYKKQKNWKLCSTRNDKKPTKKLLETKHNLDKTYNVENQEEKESSDLLNVAFIESTSDVQKTTEINPITNLKLSKQSLESVNIWPTTTNSKTNETKQNLHPSQTNAANNEQNAEKSDSYAEKPKRNFAMQRLQELQKAANIQECQQDDINNVFKEPNAVNVPNVCINNNEVGNEMEISCQWDDFCGNFINEEQLPTQSGAPMEMAQDAWFEVREDEVDGNGLEERVYSGALLTEFPCNYFPKITPEMLDMAEEEMSSVDSEASFMRGAHAASHSTEVDAPLPPELDIADVSAQSLARLSAQQLLLAAQRLARGLHRALLESERRQQLRRMENLVNGTSYDELPTRDVGLAPPRAQFRDAVLAGSHLRGGRGRGRLADAGVNGF